MLITKRVEFDYGHRIPTHKSKCRSPHGHRGVLEVTLIGHINPISGKSDDGMVLDFSDVKSIISSKIVDRFDHAFLVWSGDKKLAGFLQDESEGWKVETLPFIPTAENLSQYIYNELFVAFKEMYSSLEVFSVRFYETPNSWADSTASESIE